MFWELELNEVKEVVVDYFGFELSASLWKDYLDNKLDAEDDIRIYDEMKKRWAEAHQNQASVNNAYWVAEAFEYVQELFRQQGVEID